ncbi:DUF4429 domain-containing protein [Wenjunlia tyrosinilytica]|uniref:DUF4429 domain-containing protein n=1 Tax=Wenjunlia tyrosinilytica TaxID=1544741 RepID=A0A917ZCX7_9ACTN|nr:DUF4429 domain-containing protein [Wenjunlia tyrosinilytica]GGO80521.1 hypothetical protein GCM10012280_02630 [Wenjunlia tyrosinilytica]
MGDVLAGSNAAWEFGADSVLIRYDRGIRTPKLLQVLAERRIPYEALAGVSLAPGRRGTVVLRARPRPGADPLIDAAADQLKEVSDPYRLVLPGERALLAESCADRLRSAIDGSGPPPQRYLVTAPPPPLQFKGIDAKATFDGRAVTFRLFWSGASSTKWKAGDQTFEVSELAGVEWHSPDVLSGHLRLLVRGEDQPADASHDPAAVTFGIGYGLVHESLPFAASVLEAIGSAPMATSAVPPLDPLERPAPSEVAARIRELGELHSAGFVTDEEFTAKKADLLAEL